MGIPTFYGKWIKPHFPRAFRNRINGPFSSISFDLNSLIHDVAREVFAYGDNVTPERTAMVHNTPYKQLEQEFFLALISRILTLVQTFNGVHTVVLAVDGVAPDAKIQQQKQRRFRATLRHSEIPPVFDSNAISPGTPFMIRLDAFIKKWLVSYGNQYASKWVYSSYRVPGEGEHKILDMMRDGTISGNGAHIVYGLDADLYLLSSVSPLNGIFMARNDTVRRRTANGQFQTVEEMIYVSIDDIKTGLGLMMNSPTYLQDFIVLMSLVGNDFLPPSPAMKDLPSGLDRLINTYKRVGLPLSDNGNLIPKNLSTFLYNFEQDEQELLSVYGIKQSRVQQTYPDTVVVQGVIDGQFDFETYRNAAYTHIFSPRGNEDYVNIAIRYMKCNPFAVTEEKVDRLCDNYLTGIAWTLRYYIGGTSNINQRYVFKYTGAPLLYDLGFYAQNIDVVNGYLPDANGSYSLSILAQLVSILPPKSSVLVPGKLSKVMTEHSILADLYPKSFIIERLGEDQEYKGHVIFPPFEFQRTMNAMYLNRYYTFYNRDKPEYRLSCNIIIGSSDTRRINQFVAQSNQIERKREAPEVQLLEDGNRMYTVSIGRPWFDLIAQGKKTIEGRLNVGMFSRIQVGDVINFVQRDKLLCTRVVRAKKYPSMMELLKKEGIQNVYPGIVNPDEAVKLFMQWTTLENEQRKGVYAVEFRGCKDKPRIAKTVEPSPAVVSEVIPIVQQRNEQALLPLPSGNPSQGLLPRPPVNSGLPLLKPQGAMSMLQPVASSSTSFPIPDSFLKPVGRSMQRSTSRSRR